MNQFSKIFLENKNMKYYRIFGIILLQSVMIGCAALPAQTGDSNAQATACPTQTGTPESGKAPSGQTGKGDTGAGTPSPEQIATSQALEEQSNRNGPLVDSPLEGITPDTQPEGPGVAQPRTNLTPAPTTDVSALSTPEEQATHEESQQPYPGETPSATPCP
jgi:hypothetical protein